jgi:hypothetical protein
MNAGQPTREERGKDESAEMGGEMRRILDAWVVLATLGLAAEDARAAEPEPPVRISFDSVEGLKCRPMYKCLEAAAALVEHDRREGSCSVSTTWKAAADSYGVMTLLAEIPPTDFTGKSFAVDVKPLNKDSAVWGIELYDAQGNLVEEHRLFVAPANRWTTLNFTQGVKPQYGWLGQSGKGDLRRIARLGFRAQTRAAGQTGAALWDNFRLVSPVVREQITRAADISGTPATLSAGPTAIWLDESRGYALRGMRLAGRWLEPSAADVYPTFRFLDQAGKVKALPCSDAAWRIDASPAGPGSLAVTYSCDGAAM